MDPFQSDMLDRIAADFPTVDVLAVATELEAWAVGKTIEHPQAMLRSWCRRRADESDPSPSTAKRGPDADKPFTGWDAYGKCFRSATPVHNALTQFVRDTCRRILADYLSPAEVARLIADHHAETVRAMLTHQLAADWVLRDRFWDWQGAWASSSPASTLKLHAYAHGGNIDSHRWERLCEDAAIARGHARCWRWDGVDHPQIDLATHEGRDAAMRMATGGNPATSGFASLIDRTLREATA